MTNEELKVARHQAQLAREAATRALSGILSPSKRRRFKQMEDHAFNLIIEIENDLEDRGENVDE